jgi:putative membrane protein insertion efficiency factor
MRHVAIAVLKLYQLTISPLLPDACIFYPTCSQYALEAVEKHGTLYGFWLASFRLIRCNPWTRGGIDPVPPVSKGAPV